MTDSLDQTDWTLEQIIEHACSLAIGYGAGRDDLLPEYKATKERALEIARKVLVCGSCGESIRSDPDPVTGTACACSPKTDLEEKRALISQMVRGEDAMAPFMTNIDCRNLADFERYLAGQFRQSMELRVNLEEQGDENDLLDFVLGKNAAFHEVLLTFRRVLALEKARGA